MTDNALGYTLAENWRPKYGSANVGYDTEAAPLSSPLQAFRAQRGQPGVIQKTLGLIPGFDQDGKRGAQSWGNALMSTAQFPIDAVAGIGQAITAPARAYRGEFDPVSEEGVGEALNVAGNAMLGGLAAPKPKAATVAAVAKPAYDIDKWIADVAVKNRAVDDTVLAGLTGPATYKGFSGSDTNRHFDTGFTRGPWASPLASVADTYAGTTNGRPGNIAPMEFRFQNPTVIDAGGNLWREIPVGDGLKAKTNELANSARNAGHDGIVFRNVRDNLSFGGDPGDVYHALQRGTVYSPLTGDLLYANGGRPGATAGAALGAIPDTPSIRAYHGTSSAIDEFGSPTFWTPDRKEANGYRMAGHSGANYSGLATEKPGYQTAATYADRFGGDRDAAIRQLEAEAKPIARSSWWDRLTGAEPNPTLVASDAAVALRSQQGIDYLRNNTAPGDLGRIYQADLPNPQKTYPYRTTEDRTAAIADAKSNGYSVISLDAGRGSAPEIVTFGNDVPKNVTAELFANGGRPGAATGAALGAPQSLNDPALAEILRKYGLDVPSRPASPQYLPGDA